MSGPVALGAHHDVLGLKVVGGDHVVDAARGLRDARRGHRLRQAEEVVDVIDVVDVEVDAGPAALGVVLKPVVPAPGRRRADAAEDGTVDASVLLGGE